MPVGTREGGGETSEGVEVSLTETSTVGAVQHHNQKPNAQHYRLQ